MRRSLAVLLWCLIAAYPVIVLLGLRTLPLGTIAAILIAVALLRLWYLRSAGNNQAIPLALTLILLLVLVYTLLSGEPKSLKFYPVAVNTTLLLAFSYSLHTGIPVIERLARLQDPNLPSAAVGYTRRVTWVWCGFFLLNGLAALYTSLYCSFEVWAWYNGGIAYILMGLLFAGEYLVRRRVKRYIHAQAK